LSDCKTEAVTFSRAFCVPQGSRKLSGPLIVARMAP